VATTSQPAWQPSCRRRVDLRILLSVVPKVRRRRLSSTSGERGERCRSGRPTATDRLATVAAAQGAVASPTSSRGPADTAGPVWRPREIRPEGRAAGELDRGQPAPGTSARRRPHGGHSRTHTSARRPAHGAGPGWRLVSSAVLAPHDQHALGGAQRPGTPRLQATAPWRSRARTTPSGGTKSLRPSVASAATNSPEGVFTPRGGKEGGSAPGLPAQPASASTARRLARRGTRRNYTRGAVAGRRGAEAYIGVPGRHGERDVSSSIRLAVHPADRRRLREMQVYSEILPPGPRWTPWPRRARRASCCPAAPTASTSGRPRATPRLPGRRPVVGHLLRMQLMSHGAGGEVKRSAPRVRPGLFCRSRRDALPGRPPAGCG